MGKNDMKEPVPHDLPIDYPHVQPTPILENLKGQKGNLYPTRETICMIVIPEETHNSCNIMVEDVERLRQILTPTIHTLSNLKLVTTHITPPDDVAVATSPILDKHLNEFGEEFLDITRVAEMADGNPAKELLDIMKTYDFETFIQKLLHQLSQSSYETGKTKRGMKSHLRKQMRLKRDKSEQKRTKSGTKREA
nr:hypothetical protein [Tanacetum cinerariifolium]